MGPTAERPLKCDACDGHGYVAHHLSLHAVVLSLVLASFVIFNVWADRYPALVQIPLGLGALTLAAVYVGTYVRQRREAAQVRAELKVHLQPNEDGTFGRVP